MDPTLLLAWLHPVAMTLAIAGSAWVLALGLRMRQARVRRTRRPKEDWRRHVRLAKGALLLGALGAGLGPIAWWLRGQPLLQSLHSQVGLLTIALAAVAFLLGRRLETGRGRPVVLHGVVGMVLMLAAGLALLTGLELLP